MYLWKRRIRASPKSQVRKSPISDLKAQISNLESPIPNPRRRRIGFSTQLACEDCGIEYPLPEPRLYSFNSPLGACPVCEGFGNVIGIDMELVVPDPGKSLREGAMRPGTRRPTPTN